MGEQTLIHRTLPATARGAKRGGGGGVGGRKYRGRGVFIKKRGQEPSTNYANALQLE